METWPLHTFANFRDWLGSCQHNKEEHPAHWHVSVFPWSPKYSTETGISAECCMEVSKIDRAWFGKANHQKKKMAGGWRFWAWNYTSLAWTLFVQPLASIRWAFGANVGNENAGAHVKRFDLLGSFFNRSWQSSQTHLRKSPVAAVVIAEMDRKRVEAIL